MIRTKTMNTNDDKKAEAEEHPDTALLRAYGKMLPEDVRHERSGCVVCPHCEYREPEAAAIEARALELAAEVQQP